MVSMKNPVRIGITFCLLTFPLLPAGLSAKPPNVLLIVSEDNGPELSCYGEPFVKTPVLDGLAAEGARFDRAYVSNSPCVPGRASLFGGQFGVHNGVATHWGPGSEYRIDGDI